MSRFKNKQENLDDNNLLLIVNKKEEENSSSDFKDRKKIFSSEPTRLSAFTSSATKPNYYLKNINRLKSKIGGSQVSLSSLIDKVNDVANMANHNKFKLLKQENETIFDNRPSTSPKTKDVSIQTSSILTTQTTDTSSISSHGATVQSNTFGSIVAHFGSASIQQNQTAGFQSKRILLRAYSDGNCLSTSGESKNENLKNHTTESKLIDLSVQF
jgi:hypothetical protein